MKNFKLKKLIKAMRNPDTLFENITDFQIENTSDCEPKEDCNSEKYVSVKDAAKNYAVSEYRIRKMLHNNEVEFIRDLHGKGSKILIEKNSFERALGINAKLV